MGDIVTDIKARLSIEDVVSSYVQLKKAGRSYKGLCPFHNEKTPSFVVSPEKQIAYCFGCHKGGDIFQFIQEVEGVEFPEAIRILADRAGLKVEVEKINKKYKAGEKGLKDFLYEAHEEAAMHFQKKLFDKSAESEKVLEYLRKRGVTDETIQTFQIGFAKDSYDDLYGHLTKKGFKKDVLIKSGLFGYKEIDNAKLYDKFKGRLIFPIFDQMKRVIGFGGRALQAEQVPKYLNSPETPIYSKGKVLYGLSHAKKAMKESDKVIIVEGYFDLIALYQAGIENVVASSGTALTSDQVGLIKRFTKNIFSCFDTDSAGIEATRRAYEVALGAEIEMKTLTMPDEFKDSADFMLAKGVSGRDEFLKMVDTASDFIEFYAKLLTSQVNVKTFDGRRKFMDEVVPILKMMKSAVKMDYFVKIVASVLDTKAQFIYDEIANYKVLRVPVKESENNVVTHDKQRIDARSLLIGVLLEFPKFFAFADKLKETDFDGSLKDIYTELVNQYNASRSDSHEKWDLDSSALTGLQEKISYLALFAESYYENFSEETISGEVQKLIDRILKDRRLHQRLKLEKELKEAEEKGDLARQKMLLEEFKELITS